MTAAYGLALIAAIILVSRSHVYRHSYAVMILLALWVATVLCQRATGSFSPFACLAGLDLIAFAVFILHGLKYRWEVPVALGFLADAFVQSQGMLFGDGAVYYIAIHVIGFGQILFVSLMAWHGRRGFGSNPHWLATLAMPLNPPSEGVR